MRTLTLRNWTKIAFAISAILVYLVDCNSTVNECAYDNPLTNIINSLSYRLTNEINSTSNMIFSPFCISVALAMVYLGARGSSAKAMEDSLGYSRWAESQDPESVHQLFHDGLLNIRSRRRKYNLEVAKAFFVQSGFEVLPEYISSLEYFYSSEVQSLNFAGDQTGATEEINRWVSNKTLGKIDKLLEEPLDSDVVLILMTAIYFKGIWKYPFDTRLTKDMNFYKLDGESKSIPFMRLITKLRFFDDRDSNYTFLEMNYKGGDISMLFALPNGRGEFPSLEMTTTLLCRIRANLKRVKVSVSIPKFKMQYERELSEDMEILGLGNLFNPDKSNLSGIRIEDDLFISMMKHKAMIEVNEEGSKAAAVNAVGISSRSGMEVYFSFRADHPFLFYILDKRHGTILFTGRVINL